MRSPSALVVLLTTLLPSVPVFGQSGFLTVLNPNPCWVGDGDQPSGCAYFRRFFPAYQQACQMQAAGEFGLHTLFFDSPDDLIEISHRARGRADVQRVHADAADVVAHHGVVAVRRIARQRERGKAVRRQEVDFDIFLTKQQPTHWQASLGRLPNPSDQPCDRNTGNYDCDGAGLDPGRVPPVASFPFQGELRCIEVDQSGAPISGNHLKGEGTIVSTDGQATKLRLGSEVDMGTPGS